MPDGYKNGLVSYAPGVLISFAVYFILTEEIHWRFQMGGWLPRWLFNVADWDHASSPRWVFQTTNRFYRL